MNYFNFMLERSFWVYVEKISNNFYKMLQEFLQRVKIFHESIMSLFDMIE